MSLPNIVETLDLQTPATLQVMVDKVRPTATFFYDRYFTTNPAVDIYPSQFILFERRDKYGRVVAPLVKKGWKSSERRTYNTTMLKAGRIAPRRTLQVADLLTKGFGEQLVNSDMTPSDRALMMTVQDVTDMTNMIKRRYELMAATLLVYNSYTLTYEKSDDNGADEDIEPQEVSFIDTKDGNPTEYAPDTLWNASGGSIYDDLRAMCRQLDENGGKAVDLVLGSDAAAVFLKDKEIAEKLDNKRMEYGQLAPKIYALGAVLHGMLNVDGRVLNIIEYRECYHNENKQLVPYLPANRALILEPGCCRALFAGVTQLEQSDKRYHYYGNKIVPKYVGDVEKDELDIRLTSQPLFVPETIGGWISAEVIGETDNT